MDERTSVNFPFLTENAVFGQIWSKKIKAVSLSWNSILRLFCFRPETPFLGKFGPKNQNCQFNLKFGTWTNSNMENSMVVFTFSVLDWKHPFWVNSVQNIKIASLNWNVVSRLFWICRIQELRSLFLLLTRNILFG